MGDSLWSVSNFCGGGWLLVKSGKSEDGSLVRWYVWRAFDSVGCAHRERFCLEPKNSLDYDRILDLGFYLARGSSDGKRPESPAMNSVFAGAYNNLLSPMVLFFVLGFLAGRLKSDLTIPEGISKGLALYLMLAIGFRGGVELSHNGINSIMVMALGSGILISFCLPVIGYFFLRKTTALDIHNAAAISAHYGSVSVVTFAAAIAFLKGENLTFEPYIVAMMALMETPAIVSGLLLARRREKTAQQPSKNLFSREVFREVFLSGSVILLVGSFLIGLLTGDRGMETLAPVVETPFKGILCIFLLDMGLLAAQHLTGFARFGFRLAAFGIYMPLIGASIGLLVGRFIGLSVGGMTLMAVLSASASYIVVPAAMRIALPRANPAFYVTLSLGITFPFNLIIGIPLYYTVARLLFAL